MRLDIPDFYINSLVLPEVSCLEHLVGLTNTSNVTEENFELAPELLSLFTLDMSKKSIRIRAKFMICDHKNRLHSHDYKQHVNNLYSDERNDKPADPIDNDIIPECFFRSHWAISYSVKC